MENTTEHDGTHVEYISYGLAFVEETSECRCNPREHLTLLSSNIPPFHIVFLFPSNS